MSEIDAEQYDNWYFSINRPHPCGTPNRCLPSSAEPATNEEAAGQASSGTQPALQALAEKWPDESTAALLEVQVSLFQDHSHLSPIEKTIEWLRAELSINQPPSGSTT